eukprot:3134906-Prymnesium_polylepis.1
MPGVLRPQAAAHVAPHRHHALELGSSVSAPDEIEALQRLVPVQGVEQERDAFRGDAPFREHGVA